MSDFPRVPRDYRRAEANVEKGILAFGCLVVIGNILFWGVVAYIIMHFVLKFW